MPSIPHRPDLGERPHYGLARVLSKLGYCSRSQAYSFIRAGRVRLNKRICHNPEAPVDLARDHVEIDGQALPDAVKVYLMLNKPRGLVTTRTDEKGRPTVYQCLQGADLPWLFPVGRLDQASEGLLLFTNDTAWADHIVAPANHVPKTYHVQVDRLLPESFAAGLCQGVRTADGERLSAGAARVLRHGSRNTWLEIVLEEGKNRQIRRLLEAGGLEVLRLIRVAIGGLQLGPLAKGQFRYLTETDLRLLRERKR